MISDNWAEKEFITLDLGDDRLNKRLVKMSQKFLKTPESPINKVCENWGDTKAAYRFFKNENIDYRDITDAHANATLNRCQNESIVLAIQDTSYFNYSHHPKKDDLGILTRFKGKHKDEILTRGLCMHTTLGVSTEGLPLGVIDQKIYSREPLSPEKKELKKKSHGIALPVEEKESVRWLDSMRATDQLFSNSNVKVVTIADREADIYDLYQLADELDTNYLIRVSHNRKINKTAIHMPNTGEFLWDFIGRQDSIGNIEVKVPAKKDEPARVATCEIKVGTINLLPPRSYKGTAKNKDSLQLSIIYAKEIRKDKQGDSIEWMLCTNLPTNTLQEAIEKLHWYCLRWRIEVFFKIIKSGFKVEDCRLESGDRLIRYLAVVSVVAWQVYWLTLVSRSAPSISCEIFLNEFEWKLLFRKINPKGNIPTSPPCMSEAVTWAAQLGGFLARKGDGAPGITHIWRGLKKLSSIIEGAKIYQDIYG